MLEKLGGLARGRLQLEQRLQPRMRLLLQLGERALVFLVQPVRGHAGLGDVVHLAGADLHLDRHAEGSDQRGVQALVTVGLGDGEVVLELARHRLVHRVQRAERQVAARHVLDDDAKAVDVEHLRERQALLDHLAVDAVEVLLAALHLGGDAPLRQALLDAGEDLADHFAAVAARRADRLRQHLEAQRVLVAEREFLQLTEQVVEAEPVGDRGVDLERLVGDAAALGRTHVVQRAHVVQAVGELDEDDAQVARHRQQHLAEVLGLGLFLRAEFDLVELGQAIDQLGRHLAEALGDLRLGDVGVLHHVVEERGDQRLGIEIPVGDQRAHRDRVADVGLTADAELPGVGIGREVVGRFDAAHVLGLEVGLELGLELLEVEREHARRWRAVGLGGWARFCGVHATPGANQA